MQSIDTKVLFLHKCFVKGGGIERVHQNLSVALKEQNVFSCFFVLNAYDKSEQGFELLHNEYLAFRPEANVSLIKKVITLFEVIRANNITSIISATEQANALAMICKLRFTNLKIVYTRHCAFDVSDQHLPPWAIKLLYSFFALSGNIVGVSRALQKEIKRSVVFRKSRIHFVPNAVVSESLLKKGELKCFLPTEHPFFVAVGRLVEQKGFDNLIKSYSKALKENENLPLLVIYGEGEDIEFLESLVLSLNIQDNVVFAGYSSNPYYPINKATAFILSSRHEGMPTVLVEALALNTPVIAFDCPTGPAELITDGVNGFLVKNQDLDSLVSAILKYEKLPKEGLSQSVKDFEFPEVARKYLALCKGASNG